MFPQPTPGAAARVPHIPSVVSSKLENISRRYGQTYDSGDLYQEMALAIIERSTTDPSFLGQTPSYVVSYGAYKGKDTVKRERVIGSRTVSEDILENFEDYSEDPASFFEEYQAAVRVLDALKRLSPTQQTIVKMVYLGYSQKEISQELGISAAAVSQYRNSIRSTMARMGVGND